MNKRVLIPSAMLLITATIYTLTNCRASKNAFAAKTPTHDSRSAFATNSGSPTTDSRSAGPTLSNATVDQDFSGPIDFKNRRPEIRSLHIMTNLLAHALQPGFSLEDVVRTLRTNNQDPKVTTDNNGVTGDMTVIRTGNPYSGLRYFHAQYFSNGDGSQFVQHMSFEFRPGAQAMSEAIESIKKNFPGLGKPLYSEVNTVRWALPDGYMIEATRLDAEDIRQDDPYNTYDAADVGTIWIALQLDETEHDNEDENSTED